MFIPIETRMAVNVFNFSVVLFFGASPLAAAPHTVLWAAAWVVSIQ
jgi:hypothetical protein